MKAREGVMKSDIYGEKLKDLYPVVEPNLSDSGAADCVLEFLLMAGQRTLPEVFYYFIRLIFLCLSQLDFPEIILILICIYVMIQFVILIGRYDNGTGGVAK